MTLGSEEPLRTDDEQTIEEEFESLITLLGNEPSAVMEGVIVDGASKPSRRRARRSSRDRKKTSKAASRAVAILLAILAIAGWAAALTLNTLPAEFLELWQTQYQSTDFSITSFDTKLQGPNKLVIDITLTNNDGASTHYANVTVTLLNATGDEISNQTQATGAVAASGTWSSSYVFNVVGVGNQYENAWITIRQSS